MTKSKDEILLKALLEFSVVEVKVDDMEEVVVNEKTGDFVLKTLVKWQQADIANTNNRLYPKAVLGREIKRVKPLCAEGGVYAGVCHPVEGTLEIPQTAGLWRDVWMDEDGSCHGRLDILPTTEGKNAQMILKSGGKIGLSSRGRGTMTQKTQKEGSYFQVNNDYYMDTPGDLVLSPSVLDAGIHKVMESKYQEILDSEIKKINEEEENKIMEKEKELQEMIEKLEKEAIETKKVLEAEKTKVVDFEKRITELEEAVTKAKETVLEQIQPELDAQKEDKETTVNQIREFVQGLLSIDGVVPEKEDGDDGDEPKEGDKSQDKEIAKLQAKLDKVTAELDALNKEKEDRDKADAEAKAERERQEKLASDLEEELKKDVYKPYTALIKERLEDEDGKILIDAETSVEDAVKAKHQELSDLAVKMQKSEIVDSNLEPKGKVKNLDADKGLTKDKVLEQYKTATEKFGYRGTLKEYVEAKQIKITG